MSVKRPTRAGTQKRPAASVRASAPNSATTTLAFASGRPFPSATTPQMRGSATFAAAASLSSPSAKPSFARSSVLASASRRAGDPLSRASVLLSSAAAGGDGAGADCAIGDAFSFGLSLVGRSSSAPADERAPSCSWRTGTWAAGRSCAGTAPLPRSSKRLTGSFFPFTSSK